MKIAVVGMGYVGLSIAVILAQQNQVVALDIIPEKVRAINHGISPIQDELINQYLNTKGISLKATIISKEAFSGATYIIICTPTNYIDKRKSFDTSSIEMVLETVLRYNKEAIIVIKSTVPIGYTTSLKKKYGYKKILYSPEFLRESQSLYDCLHPSRIIVGTEQNDSQLMICAGNYLDLMQRCCIEQNVATRIMGTTEAEAVKLFSNTYLAMRIAYINEIDSYSMLNGLQAKDIIEGMGLDPRIGLHYNNPSFGYGGYCLPKDTKQLLASYSNVPQNIISAVVKSNKTRIDLIFQTLMITVNSEPFNSLNNKTVGIYRLLMKKGADNFRNSAVVLLIKRIKKRGITVIVYEPLLRDNQSFIGCKVVNNIEKFKGLSGLIIANRNSRCLDDVKEKVFSRDLFGSD